MVDVMQVKGINCDKSKNKNKDNERHLDPAMEKQFGQTALHDRMLLLLLTRYRFLRAECWQWIK